MWIDSDGVVNSNAHANPAEAVTEQMWQSLVLIAQNEGESASQVFYGGFYGLLDEFEDESLLAEVTPGLEDQWIPDEYLDGDFSASGEVRNYLNGLPIDWRSEAFMVVANILDEMTAKTRWQRLVNFFRFKSA